MIANFLLQMIPFVSIIFPGLFINDNAISQKKASNKKNNKKFLLVAAISGINKDKKYLPPHDS